MAGQKVQAFLQLGAACGALLLGAGCTRKAPGPDECVAFAKVWVERRRVSQQPAAAAVDPFDELVRDCLTKPYDRALVECVIEGGAPDTCRAAYVRRVQRELDEGSR
jgi:hypothetical protein